MKSIAQKMPLKNDLLFSWYVLYLYLYRTKLTLIYCFFKQILLNEKKIPKENDILELQEGSKEASHSDSSEETFRDDDSRLFEQRCFKK